ncbi:MAG: hypothetical protein MJ218_02940 [Opitutales bacterium]|nr:hypothetical protein [Opitutales bacterium]
MTLSFHEMSWAADLAAVDNFKQTLTTRDGLNELPMPVEEQAMLPDVLPSDAVAQAAPMNFSELVTDMARKVGNANTAHLERLQPLLSKENLTPSDYLGIQWEMMGLVVRNDLAGRLGSGAVNSIQTLFKNQ